MKRYYDSVNFLVNYIGFQKSLATTSDKQVKNNRSLDEMDYLVKNSNEIFPPDEKFNELYEAFFSGRDRVGKYTWENTEDATVPPVVSSWTVSGKAFKKHKVYLTEVE